MTLARYEKAFIEYSKEEERDEYEFKFGLECETDNHWFFYLTHQLEEKENAEAKTYAEVKYIFPQNFTAALQYETYHSRDALGFKLCKNCQFGKSLSSGSSITYTQYLPQADKYLEPDFTELKFYNELKYRIKEFFLVIVGCEYINADYEQNVLNPADNPDYLKMEYLTGLEYRFSKAGILWGRYYFDAINYDNVNRNNSYSDKLVFGVNYNYHKYAFYCSYPFPQEGNSSTFGVSYRF
jgi:hypothetical protein